MRQPTGGSPTVTLDLGPPGASWIRSSLRDGLALSKVFLRRRGSELEGAATFAPRELDRQEAIRSLPNKALLALPESERHLTRMLVEKAAPSSLLIVEDDLGRAGDSYLEQVNNPLFYVDDQVYHLFHLVDDPAKMGAALRSGSGYPLNAFVVPPSAVPTTTRLSSPALELIADSVALVVVMAFDAGGYVIWDAERDGPG